MILNYLSEYISTTECDLNTALKEALSFYIPLYQYHARWETLNSDDFLRNAAYFTQGGLVVPNMAGWQC